MTHPHVAAALAAEHQRDLRAAADGHHHVALVRCCRRSLLGPADRMNASARTFPLRGRLSAAACLSLICQRNEVKGHGSQLQDGGWPHGDQRRRRAFVAAAGLSQRGRGGGRGQP